MIIQLKDIVLINNADKEEAIGLYGRVTEFVGKDQYRVLYRHSMVGPKGLTLGNSVIIKYDDMSLVAQHKENKAKEFKLDHLRDYKMSGDSNES